MNKRAKQLITLIEEGKEEAIDDLFKEFPGLYYKMFPEEKIQRKEYGGEVKAKKSSKKFNRPRCVGAAKKGFGKALKR
jgi:hypothetical protein